MSEVSAVKLKKVENTFPSKTSSSFDGLSMKILKLIFPNIATVLPAIINKSFMLETFPNMLKVARMVSVFKGGANDKIVHYRPISILPIAYQKFSNV